MYGYSAYSHSRSVYFKTLLEQSFFKHLQGEISKNAFDKIKIFTEDKEYDYSCETIFKVDNYYIFGYYVKLDKKFYLRKFID